MPALDRYDNRDIDDDVEEEDFEEREAARLRAERAMDRADGRRRARLPGALLEGQASWLRTQFDICHLCMPDFLARLPPSIDDNGAHCDYA